MTELVYTDGACSKNGTKNSTGGFGIFIAKSNIFSAPVYINKKGSTTHFKNETFYVTNIRMEGLALVSTFSLYTRVLCSPSLNSATILNEYDPFAEDVDLSMVPMRKPIIEIVTDSQFWINVINLWLPNWIRKDIYMEKKNPDIIMMLIRYLNWFKDNGIMIKYTFVRSHQKGKRSAHADGNDMADKLATSAVQNPTNKFNIHE